MYPDEAIMEMEAKQRAGEAGRGGDDPLHLLADDRLDVRARLAVVVDAELIVGEKHQSNTLWASCSYPAQQTEETFRETENSENAENKNKITWESIWATFGVYFELK